MRKVNCIFDSVEEAERAKERILSECGGDCSIREHKKENNDDFLLYPIPSNFGTNIAPTTPTDLSFLQVVSPIKDSNRKSSKCTLSYMGFDSQAKKAEDILINLRAEKVQNHPFP